MAPGNTLALCKNVASLFNYKIRRSLVVAYNQMQFFRSPLLHKLDQIALNNHDSIPTTVKFTNDAQQKHQAKMSKLQNVTDDNYSDLQIPCEILHTILMFSNDYYDHIASMYNDLTFYQYFLPQLLDLLQPGLLVMLLILPPNCIFFSVLFGVYGPMAPHRLLDEYHDLFEMDTRDAYEYAYTDHELLGFLLCITSCIHISGCLLALFLNYNTQYIEKWMVIKNILKTTHDNKHLLDAYPFELLYPYQKWCCIHHNYFLRPHASFNNLQTLKHGTHSMFWRVFNPLCLYVTYCLFKPLLTLMMSIYYWHIYRFSLTEGNNACIQFGFFMALICFFALFLYRDVCRILCDGWIGSRVSCLLIIGVYLQIYCSIQNIEMVNIIVWMMAAGVYKLTEYLVLTLYFQTYVNVNHCTTHSIQQLVHDWSQTFAVFFIYLYGFCWLFVADSGQFFIFSEWLNSMLRVCIGGFIWFDSQLDLLIFDKTIQSMTSKLDVLRFIVFSHEWKLMADWRRKLS